jgi:hypothetical protein
MITTATPTQAIGHTPLFASPISALTRSTLAAHGLEWLITTTQHLARENEIIIAENHRLRTQLNTPRRTRSASFPLPRTIRTP